MPITQVEKLLPLFEETTPTERVMVLDMLSHLLRLHTKQSNDQNPKNPISLQELGISTSNFRPSVAVFRNAQEQQATAKVTAKLVSKVDEVTSYLDTAVEDQNLEVLMGRDPDLIDGEIVVGTEQTYTLDLAQQLNSENLSEFNTIAVVWLSVFDISDPRDIESLTQQYHENRAKTEFADSFYHYVRIFAMVSIEQQKDLALSERRVYDWAAENGVEIVRYDIDPSIIVDFYKQHSLIRDIRQHIKAGHLTVFVDSTHTERKPCDWTDFMGELRGIQENMPVGSGGLAAVILNRQETNGRSEDRSRGFFYKTQV